jgi:hypothetical protein
LDFINVGARLAQTVKEYKEWVLWRRVLQCALRQVEQESAPAKRFRVLTFCQRPFRIGRTRNKEQAGRDHRRTELEQTHHGADNIIFKAQNNGNVPLRYVAAFVARFERQLTGPGGRRPIHSLHGRGGDAWDQKIRQQIRDCALFIPIISAQTATRHEGYFRLEWDLADQRTHMIARNKAFIIPVCLDVTPDAGADVPDSFQRVQWTRLPAGETPPALVTRLSQLTLAMRPGSSGWRRTPRRP